ncbi:sugar transferase [Cyclobacterium sp. 1_MG-2023]|nr:sugar transferase [Cyclobacterium sp. 1_MG-2023]MDO6440373.1 sugar transferase [Cyclobacterium sp. 1_MG-2023]
MGKRIFDLFVSFVLLLLFLPLMLLIALLLLWEFKGKVFFIQSRSGKMGKPFKLLKFKTMADQCGPNGLPLADELRLTSIGIALRKTSLDELPQLINVLKGEMSLVGPRPLLPEYLPLYSEEQNKRHEVLPGITGLAQVKGRNSIDWSTKFKYDVWYVRNHNFFLDLKIMFLTIKPLLYRENVDFQNEVSTEKFTGTQL